MVDETSNKIKTIWAFNPAELKEDILKILVGRDREISDLIQWLKINKGLIPEKHRLFHGPRGIGKTTLLLAVYYTILKTPNLLKAFLPITFSEDSSLMTNEANFVKAVYDFISQNTEKLEITDKFHQHKWASSIDSLIEFSHISNRTLVFLIDNFQAFLGSVLEGRGSRRGAAEGPKFLKKLLSTPEFLIIACSLKRSDKIKNKKEAPYWERFEQENLPKLKDFSEASSLLFKRAELEGKDFFSRNFPKLSGRIRAIFALSEGNPRYLVLLYQILRKEKFENLQVDFCSILDGLTGVLDAEIERQLSPRQKPVLKALCQCGGRGTVKDVIKEYFIKGFEPDAKLEKEIGNDLSSLTETDFVEVDKEAKGRLKVYQITPPLFQLWFEMRHLGRSHHVILLEIFERYYKLPFEDLSTAYHTLLGDIRLRPETVSARSSEFLLYSHLAEKGSEHLLDLMDVTRSVADSEKKDDYVNLLKEFEKQFQFFGNKEKKYQNQLNQVYYKYHSNNLEEAEEQVKKLIEEIKGEDIPLIEAISLWLLAAIRIKQKNPKSALEICEKAFDVAKKLELTEKQRLLGDIYYTQGNAYGMQNEHEQAISSFEKALEFHRKSERKREQALDLEGIGVSIGNRGDHEKAVQYFQESLELWNQMKEKKVILRCLYNLSLELYNSGKLDEAVEKWNNTIALSREMGKKEIEADALRNLGAALFSKGDYEGSIKASEEAIALSREMGNKVNEAVALINLGAALFRKGDNKGAIKASEQAIALSREIGDKETEAGALMNLSAALRRKGDNEGAIKASEQSIALSREIGNKLTEADALTNLFEALKSKGDYEGAIKESEQAIALSRVIGDKETEAGALRNLSAALVGKGDYDGAVKAGEQAIGLSHEIGNKETETDALTNLSAALGRKGDYEGAIKASEQAIALSREIGNKETETDALTNLSKALINKCDYEGSIKASEQAIVLSREIGNKVTEAMALKNLSEALFNKGDYESAIKTVEQVIALSREIGDKETEAVALGNLSLALYSKGEYEGAIKASEQAIALSREIGDKVTETGALSNLSAALINKGDYDDAIKASEQAIGLSHEIGNKETETDALTNLSAALGRKGDYEGVIKASEQAVALSHEIGDKGVESGALWNLSAVLLDKGDYEGAVKACEQAIVLSREIGDKGAESGALWNLSAALFRKWEYEGAIKASEQAITLSREIGDKGTEAGALMNLSAALSGKGDYESAVKASEQSISLSREIGDTRTLTGALKNLFRAHLGNSRELVISSKPAKAAQELESARDSLCGFDSPEESIPFLNYLLFIPLLSKGFYKESFLLKESVERWNVKELNDYLTILNAVIKKFQEPNIKLISSLPPVERSVAYEMARTAKGLKTMSEAAALFDSGKQEEALEIVETLARDNPDDLMVLRSARSSYQMAKRIDKAEYYSKIILDSPESVPEDLGEWGIILMDKEQTEEAEKYLLEAVRKGSQIYRHYSCLSNIHDKRGNFLQAYEVLKKALENITLEKQEEINARLNLTEYLLMLNQTEEAFKTLEKIDLKEITPPRKTDYLFQKYLLSCIQSDQGAASSALKDFCDLLMEQGDKACSTYDFTNLIHYATNNLGEKQITLLRRWADTAKGLMTMSEFIQIYGTEEQREKAAKEWNDERSLAIHRLKSGKIKSLDDIARLSTGSNPIETSLDAYSYFYNDLSDDLQTISRGLIIEGLSVKNPTVNKTAAQSAGTLFWNFPPKERNKALSGMLSIAQQSEAPADLRDAALSVITALFFRLEPSQQDMIIPVLRKVEKEYSPVYLRQLISRIDRKEEEKS